MCIIGKPLDIRHGSTHELSVCTGSKLTVGLVRFKTGGYVGNAGRRPEMERASGLGRILVVDDSASDRMVIRKALDRIGCETLVDAVSGEDALARLRAEEFDVVISDYSLGFMDGISLLEIVRRDAPRACRVLVTGHAHFDLARDAINRAGVHAFLEKPVEPAKLKAAIETAMARSRAEHPSV